MASHAARAKRHTPRRQVQEISAALAGLYTDVLAGRVSAKVAAVAAQVANTRIRALDTERRWYEAEELEARISELERRREIAS